MGTKFKCFVIVLFFLSLVLGAQENMDFQSVDSLMYKYYKSGEWDRLIDLGNKAIHQNIDYKFLRQRMGYAYFTKGDYFKARKHFERALSFDSYDEFTLTYLYYSYLNSGQEEFALYFTRKMNQKLKKSISVRSLRLFESIDVEYNYKFNNTISRSNPQYYRLGINTQLGYTLMLYQSFSNYNQLITFQNTGNNRITTDNQPEYYALLKLTLSRHLLLKTAYHYIYSTFTTSSKKGNLGLFALSSDLSRFSFEACFSALNINQESTYQSGVKGRYYFPGKSNIYLTSAVSKVFKPKDSRFIYNQLAGFKALKKIWLEVNLTIGRMTDYNDYNGLYVYNLFDPMVSRSGATLFFFLNRNITLWVNYSFEQKEYFENNSFHYNQFSYLGGIKWKL